MKNNKYYERVVSYFNDKSDLYDDVDNQLYWVFSDTFFKEVLKKEIPRIFADKKKIKMLDAGAGTARWTFFLYDMFNKKYNISGILVDISSGMLKVAENKIAQKKLENKFKCIIGNIENMDDVEVKSFDLAISFYNVLSFVEKPKVALKEIYNKLKKGGVHISIVANKYHAFYFSILTSRFNELNRITKDSKIKFNNDMPYIHCFTPLELQKLYKESGFKSVKIIGGPNFIYPGMEETYIHGSTKQIQNKLEDRNNFNKLLKVELENYENGDIAGRGNVLMVIAQK